MSYNDNSAALSGPQNSKDSCGSSSRRPARREAIKRFCERIKTLLEKRNKSAIASDGYGDPGRARGRPFYLSHSGGTTLGPTSRYVDAVWQVWLEDMLQHNTLPHYSTATGISAALPQQEPQQNAGTAAAPREAFGGSPATTFNMEDANLLTLVELQTVLEGDRADVGYLVGHRVHPMLLEEELEAMTAKVEASSSYQKFKRYERRMKERNDARILRRAERRHHRKMEWTRQQLISGQPADASRWEDVGDDDDAVDDTLALEREQEEEEEEAYGRVPAIISASTMTAYARSVSMLWPAAGITREAKNELNGGTTGFTNALRHAVASGATPTTSMGGWASQPPLLLFGSTGGDMLPPMFIAGATATGAFSTVATSIFQEDTYVSSSSSGSTNSVLAMLPALPPLTTPLTASHSLQSMPPDTVLPKSLRSTPSLSQPLGVVAVSGPLGQTGSLSAFSPAPGAQPRLHFNFDCNPPQVTYEWVQSPSMAMELVNQSAAAAAAAGGASQTAATKITRKISVAPPRRVLDPCFLEVVLSRLPLLQSLVFCDTAMPLIDKDLMRTSHPSFEHINLSVWRQLRRLSPQTAASSPLNDTTPAGSSNFNAAAGVDNTDAGQPPFASLQELRLLGCTLSGGEGSQRRLSSSAREAHQRMPKTPMRGGGSGSAGEEERGGSKKKPDHADPSLTVGSAAPHRPSGSGRHLSTTELTPRRVNGKVPPPAKLPGSPREFGPYGVRSNCLTPSNSSPSFDHGSDPALPNPPPLSRDRINSGATATPRQTTVSPRRRGRGGNSPPSSGRGNSPRLSRGGGGGSGGGNSPRLSRGGGGGGGGTSPRMRSTSYAPNDSVSTPSLGASMSSSTRRRSSRRVKPTMESFGEDEIDLTGSPSRGTARFSTANSSDHTHAMPRHGSTGMITSPGQRSANSPAMTPDKRPSLAPRDPNRSSHSSPSQATPTRSSVPHDRSGRPVSNSPSTQQSRYRQASPEGYYRDPRDFSENYQDSDPNPGSGVWDQNGNRLRHPAPLIGESSMDANRVESVFPPAPMPTGPGAGGVLRGGSQFGIEARELARLVRIGERRLLTLEDGRATDKAMEDYIAAGYINGHLPDLEWIAYIPSLKRLYLDRCSLQDQNMQWMESLPHLTLFSATHTNLRRVGFLRGVAGSLTDLNLSHCPWLPSGEELRALPLLEHLSLAFTPIRDADFVTSCPNLVSLHLNGCRRLERADAIGQLKQLRVLNISRTGIRTLDWIASCSPQTLECVDVSYCEGCPASAVSVLGRVPKLRFLNISGMLLSSAARERLLLQHGTLTRYGYSEDQRRKLLRRLPRSDLVTSNLHSNSSSVFSSKPTSLEWIKQCRCLQELWCLDAGDSVENIQVLASLSQTLQLLHLTHTKSIVTDTEWLSWGENLTMLNLANNKALRDVSGLRELKNLKHLSLACTPIDDSAVDHLLPSASTLHTLDLSYCHRFNTFSRLASFKQLRHLYLSGTSVSRIEWLPACSLLQRVQLNDCIQLRNVNALQQLPRLRKVRVDYSPVIDLSWIPFLTKLEELNLAGCTNTVDYPLIAKCRHLKQLNLSYTCISDTEWIRGLPHLQMLTLQHCSGVSHLNCLTSRRVTSLRLVDVEGSELVYNEKALNALKSWAEDAGVLLTWQPEDNFYPFDPNANPNTNSATARAMKRYTDARKAKEAENKPVNLNSNNRAREHKREKKTVAQREGKENARLPPLQHKNSHAMPYLIP